MKNISAGEIVQAYQAHIDRLNTTGIFLLEHILDNECSALFQATNPTQQDDLSTCTSARPQAQLSQKSNPHV
jgi:hypothetical protein